MLPSVAIQGLSTYVMKGEANHLFAAVMSQQATKLSQRVSPRGSSASLQSSYQARQERFKERRALNQRFPGLLIYLLATAVPS